MRDRGIAPDEITYSSAIAACGNAGQASPALDLLKVCLSLYVYTCVYLLNLHITAQAAPNILVFLCLAYGSTLWGEISVCVDFVWLMEDNAPMALRWRLRNPSATVLSLSPSP